MRWEDERYVRIYTRDTADWLALSFDAQALFCLLLRKVDRAGLLPLGKHGKRAVAAVIGQVALWSRLEPALEELLADGCIRLERDVLVVPNFIEAQEASMSDRQRKAEQRARDRDQSGQGRDKGSRSVTGSHAGSREVTPGHTESREVTPCRAVPCSTEPEEDAAATRASARSDSDEKGSEVGGLHPIISAEAPASEPAPPEAPPPARPVPLRAVALVVDDDLPRRPLDVLDTVELDEGGAELRAKLQRLTEWSYLVAAHDRKVEVRASLERLVEALGVDRSLELCRAVVKRRRAQGLQPPKAMAFFVPMLTEAAQGGDPMPAEVEGVELNQVMAAHNDEVARRWAPLLAQMNPAQREAYEAEKARLASEVLSQGLWSSEETRQLHQAEEFLFAKWSRKTASGEA